MSVRILNVAQLWLVANAIQEGGNAVFVGDKHQAIFGFAGADHNSFDNITVKMNAKIMPLSYCWRCPVEVIHTAQAIVPGIRHAPDAKQGLVKTINEGDFETLVSARDMVICRVTAPLISTAFKFIRQGRPVKVRGRDIGNGLKAIIKKIKTMPGYSFEEFPQFLSRYKNREHDLLIRKQADDSKVLALFDKIESIEAIYDKVVSDGGEKTDEMLEQIDLLFEDKGGSYISLMTIHKCKGLQANNVFILCPELIPHPMGMKSQAQKQQEFNLKYVAITRAQEALYWVTTTKK